MLAAPITDLEELVKATSLRGMLTKLQKGPLWQGALCLAKLNPSNGESGPRLWLPINWCSWHIRTTPSRSTPPQKSSGMPANSKDGTGMTQRRFSRYSPTVGFFVTRQIQRKFHGIDGRRKSMHTLKPRRRPKNWTFQKNDQSTMFQMKRFQLDSRNSVFLSLRPSPRGGFQRLDAHDNGLRITCR